MIRNPIDAAIRVSPHLSALIEHCVNDPDADMPITLAMVRSYISGLLPTTFKEAEHRHHFDVSESILDELDALLEEFGGDMLAVNFMQTVASEALSRVIEHVVGDENRENPPTLATVREAMVSGLLSRMVGEGALEDDEDDNLQAEIEALIDRFGNDALAESFIRYE